MNKLKQRILSILLVLGMLMIPTLIVSAKEGIALTISGPGIKGEITLDSSDQLWRVEDSGFFGFSDKFEIIEAPESPGEGYNITASIIEDGELIPFVVMVYYPTGEEAGLVNYISRINNDALQPVDEWARLSPNADKAFRALMESNNIVLQTAAPAQSKSLVEPQTQTGVQPSSPVIPTAMQIPYIAVVIATGIIVLIGSGLVLRKRTGYRRSA